MRTRIAIENAFADGEGRPRKAFIAFITCGDPDLETTKAVVKKSVEAGCDLVELGIPFSDPTAEGPVIMEADNRALSGGCTTDAVFDMTRQLREEGIDVPFVYMTYANVVYSYGMERFCERAAGAGVQGMILPDVPFEEKEEFAPVLEKYGLTLISMIAPTSENRIAAIAREAKGFVYMVSSLGVTGVRSRITTDIGAMTALVRANTGVPCAVGFGISTPEQAAAMAAVSDGAIVGSAIVRLIAEHGRDAAGPVYEYVKAMAESVHSVG